MNLGAEADIMICVCGESGMSYAKMDFGRRGYILISSRCIWGRGVAGECKEEAFVEGTLCLCPVSLGKISFPLLLPPLLSLLLRLFSTHLLIVPPFSTLRHHFLLISLYRVLFTLSILYCPSFSVYLLLLWLFLWYRTNWGWKILQFKIYYWWWEQWKKEFGRNKDRREETEWTDKCTVIIILQTCLCSRDRTQDLKRISNGSLKIKDGKISYVKTRLERMMKLKWGQGDVVVEYGYTKRTSSSEDGNGILFCICGISCGRSMEFWGRRDEYQFAVSFGWYGNEWKSEEDVRCMNV